MWIVTYQLKVLELKVEQVLYIGVDNHLWQRTRLAGKLELGLLDVIKIQMGVTGGVDEVASLEASNLSHHLQQESIACDVERNTKEGVGRALVELQRESAISHIELEDGMTRGQGHLVYLGHVPCRNNHSA